MSEVVLITGAGIGIGRATAKAFAKAGHHVVVTDILEKEGMAVVGEIAAAKGSAEFQRLDVRSTGDAEAVVAAVERKHGAIGTIVANAGIAHRVPLPELTDEKWDYTFDIDLKGIFRVVRAAAPRMKAAKKGAIVCVSSIMGVAYGWDEHVHYSSAKAGVVGLVRGLAVELARDGIRVNGIAPGLVDTKLTKVTTENPDRLAASLQGIPMRRLGTPEDMAGVALFLASPLASYVLGQTIPVDGGLIL